MNDQQPKKYFFCAACKKDKLVELKAVNAQRKSVYCIECDERAKANTGVYPGRKKARKYTWNQIDHMMQWIDAKGG